MAHSTGPYHDELSLDFENSMTDRPESNHDHGIHHADSEKRDAVEINSLSLPSPVSLKNSMAGHPESNHDHDRNYIDLSYSSTPGPLLSKLANEERTENATSDEKTHVDDGEDSIDKNSKLNTRTHYHWDHSKKYDSTPSNPGGPQAMSLMPYAYAQTVTEDASIQQPYSSSLSLGSPPISPQTSDEPEFVGASLEKDKTGVPVDAEGSLEKFKVRNEPKPFLPSSGPERNIPFDQKVFGGNVPEIANISMRKEDLDVNVLDSGFRSVPDQYTGAERRTLPTTTEQSVDRLTSKTSPNKPTVPKRISKNPPPSGILVSNEDLRNKPKPLRRAVSEGGQEGAFGSTDPFTSHVAASRTSLLHTLNITAQIPENTMVGKSDSYKTDMADDCSDSAWKRYQKGHYDRSREHLSRSLQYRAQVNSPSPESEKRWAKDSILLGEICMKTGEPEITVGLLENIEQQSTVSAELKPTIKELTEQAYKSINKPAPKENRYE